jgi:hypothetical protein
MKRLLLIAVGLTIIGAKLGAQQAVCPKPKGDVKIALRYTCPGEDTTARTTVRPPPRGPFQAPRPPVGPDSFALKRFHYPPTPKEERERARRDSTARADSAKRKP